MWFNTYLASFPGPTQLSIAHGESLGTRITQTIMPPCLPRLLLSLLGYHIWGQFPFCFFFIFSTVMTSRAKPLFSYSLLSYTELYYIDPQAYRGIARVCNCCETRPLKCSMVHGVQNFWECRCFESGCE